MGLLSVLGLPKRQVAAPAPDAEGDGARADAADAGDELEDLDADDADEGDTAPAPGKPVGDYERARDEVRKLLEALKKHRQKAHVAGEIGTATTRLASAASLAAKGEKAKATAEVEAARRACVAGKGFADKYAAYMARRAEAVSALNAADVGGMAADASGLAAADAKAALPARDYAGATAAVQAIVATHAAKFKPKFVDKAAPKIAALKAHKAAAFVATEIARIEALQKQVVDALAAKAWRKAHLTAIRIGGVFEPTSGLLDVATRMADRRAVFDEQRTKTLVEVGKVRTRAALAAQAGLLDGRLLMAYKQGSHEQMQIDDGVIALKGVTALCAKLLALADSAQAYAAERAPVEAGLAALEKHPAAAKVAAEIAALRRQLDAAAGQAGNPGTGPHGVIGADLMRHHFEPARALLRQAAGDLAAAKQVADGLKGVAAAESAAAGSDPAKIRAGAAALQKDLAAAKKSTHAALAGKELGAAETALKDVEPQLKAKQPAAAAQALANAAAQLVAARRIEVEKARYDSERERIDKRGKALAALPEAKAIQPRIEAVLRALAEAARQDGAGAWPQAMAALRLADEAAVAAEQTAAQRKAFDVRALALKPLIAAPAHAKLKAEQEKALKLAHAQADAFAFVGAGRTLDEIQNRVDGAEVEALAKTAPNDPKLDQAVQRMMKNNGQKAIDALIQHLPNDVDKALLQRLAKARFDLEVVADDGPGAQRALKQMCKLMATVPADVVTRNPSLKKVSRIADGGASYSGNTQLVKMNSRPGKTNKADFGPGNGGRLPAKREKGFEPANNDPADLFDFNMLHELAHSIDDANNFMPRKERDPEFGGWIAHGGEVESIAAAVCAKTGFDLTAEERQYVMDRILYGAKAVAPAPPEGDAKALKSFKARKKAVVDWHKDATSKDVWSDEAACGRITMPDKRIYHLAYSGKWVSYLASARARGITGYQFRAPGEWFSELYAAWKLGKLKVGHPSIKWLAGLSI